MNATDEEIKYRQLHIEGSSQKISAEQRKYAKAYASSKIAENNITNVNLSRTDLLEKILDRDNMNKAFKKVVSNKGTCGVDGMKVDKLLAYLKENKESLLQSIRNEKYHPNPVKRVEIPKEDKGKMRNLGIPTVVDRVIQQAISQVLTPIFEYQFSESSFGFRPGRNAHDAMRKCTALADEGYKYVVDMDLEKYFDTVNHSKLIEILSRTIKDGRVISLIHKYLNAGVMIRHKFEKTDVGVPQGGPLSPLLSNIMLNELDKELERRGHKFARYADDLIILCKSKKSAERALRNITPFIENKLYLKINKEKTTVNYIGEVKYLGFTFYKHKSGFRLKTHPKSIIKMKRRVKELTSRSNGWGNEFRAVKLRRFIKGWLNYFKIADMREILRIIDKWMRRRIRMIYWKQWKKISTRYKMLRHFGIASKESIKFANTRKGYWRVSNSHILGYSLTNHTLAELGFIFFSDYYVQIKVN